MILIVGLGNPGEKFEKTRHNLGWQVLDDFARKNEFAEFKPSKKSNSLLSEKIIYGKKIVLVKPQTFMNNSGQAVKKLTTREESPLLWVIHDDLDLELGKIKIIKDRGSAGHKGIQSIINEIKSKDFVRFRLGIGKQTAENSVIKKFSLAEKESVNKIIKRAGYALELALEKGVETAMNEINKKED